MRARTPPRSARAEPRPAPSVLDPPVMSGESLWTVGVGILAFQIVVMVGFAAVGLSLTIRPTA